MRKREFAMQMRKCKKVINRCNAITFKSLANAKMDSHYQPCLQMEAGLVMRIHRPRWQAKTWLLQVFIPFKRFIASSVSNILLSRWPIPHLNSSSERGKQALTRGFATTNFIKLGTQESLWWFALITRIRVIRK